MSARVIQEKRGLQDLADISMAYKDYMFPLPSRLQFNDEPSCPRDNRGNTIEGEKKQENGKQEVRNDPGEPS